MTEYKCLACSHKPKGDFIFTVEYSDSDEEAPVTRCPNCGRLTLSPDVERV